MKSTLPLALALTGLLSILAPNQLPGQAAGTISYQGLLTSSGGELVSDASYSILFSIYDVPSGGSALWSETQSVATVDGIFNVMLGSEMSLSGVDFDQELWLGIKVESDPEMMDRTMLTSVPSAFSLVHPYSANVDTSAPAIEVTNSGVGDAIAGINSGEGWAGRFLVSNPSSPTAALYAATNGTGPAIFSQDEVFIVTNAIGAPPDASVNEDFTIQASDALIGLYSNASGVAGSGVQLGEIASSMLTNKWSMYRGTTSAAAPLHFSFGTLPAYGQNPTLVSFDSSGVVTASGFHYTTPDTHWVSIPGSAFIPEVIDSATVWNEGHFLGQSSQLSGRATSPLLLPDGAEIREFLCTMYDVTASADLQCSLFERVDELGLGTLLGTALTTTGDGGLSEPGALFGIPVVVDNRNKSYGVRVRPTMGGGFVAWAPHGSSLEIVKVHVGYTMHGPQ